LKHVLAALALAVVLNTTLATCAPASDDPNFDRAVALYNQRQYSAALPFLQRSLLAPTPSPTAVYYAGLCYQQTGNMSMAQKCYQVLSDDFAGSPEAKLALPVLARLKSSSVTVSSPSGSASGTRLAEPRLAPTSAMSPGQVTSYLRSYQMDDKEWSALPDESKVPFKRSTSSHLFVNGTVNGRSMQMMFDTGAEQCHFSRAQLHQLGIDADANAARVAVSGVGGQASCAVLMADIGVGEMHRKIPVLVDDVDLGMPIIGETWFKEFRYDIDNSSGFIRFVKKPRQGVISHSYESTDVIPIPYRSLGDNMIVQAKVNGQPCPMIFDTGSFSICFNAIDAARLHLSIPSDAKMLMTSGAGGMVPAYQFEVDRIELGPLIKTHVTVVVNRAETPMLPLLGQPFYKDRHFTVDNEKHLIKFAH
jgi:clan AA aspartic protease (TIGR02281 family)